VLPESELARVYRPQKGTTYTDGSGSWLWVCDVRPSSHRLRQRFPPIADTAVLSDVGSVASGHPRFPSLNDLINGFCPIFNHVFCEAS
jgi:hypothetical protein